MCEVTSGICVYHMEYDIVYYIGYDIVGFSFDIEGKSFDIVFRHEDAPKTLIARAGHGALIQGMDWHHARLPLPPSPSCPGK